MPSLLTTNLRESLGPILILAVIIAFLKDERTNKLFHFSTLQTNECNQLQENWIAIVELWTTVQLGFVVTV